MFHKRLIYKKNKLGDSQAALYNSFAICMQNKRFVAFLENIEGKTCFELDLPIYLNQHVISGIEREKLSRISLDIEIFLKYSND